MLKNYKLNTSSFSKEDLILEYIINKRKVEILNMKHLEKNLANLHNKLFSKLNVLEKENLLKEIEKLSFNYYSNKSNSNFIIKKEE